MEKNNSKQTIEEPTEAKFLKANLTKRFAVAAVFVGVGLVLSYFNPFAYFLIFETKINPFVHLINSLMGVLIGLTFACVTATCIAILRFLLGIGTIHAFHGGISGAVIVGISSYILRKKFPKYTNYASLLEPIGTVFIGGSIADIIAAILYGVPIFEFILFWWVLFALSCIPGAILGFLMLKVLKKAGITWEDFF